MVNDCMSHALVDTGSEVSLAKSSFIDSLGLECHQMRNLPRLAGITQNILPVRGTVYLRVHIGNRVVTHLFSVVPDGYLDTELLLGADLIMYAPLTLDSLRKVIVWDGCTYPVRMLKPRPSRRRVREVTVVKPSEPGSCQVRLKEKLILPQYKAGIYSVHIKEPPDTLVEFTAEVDCCQPCTSLCLRVNETQEVFLPLVNSSKARITMKAGTLLGTYRKIEETDINLQISECRKTRIQNDLVPQSNGKLNPGISRVEMFRHKLSQQDFSHLLNEEQTQLRGLLEEHHQVFIVDEHEMGKFKDVQAHINVSDSQPVRSPIYRYPEKAKGVISSMLQEMEEKGIIEPSTAAWLSPIVLVKKPDGTQRMCLDYRRVNTHLQVDIHPLPRLEEMVETAAGNSYYASLDMKDAYYQVELDEASRDLTTFSDGVSLYRFKRLPFGLSCSPAIFSRIMSNILAPLIKKGWLKNYLDDIIVWAPSFPALVRRLGELFGLFCNRGVKLNIGKCQFGQREIKFLGHIISKEGCRPAQIISLP